MAPRRRLFPLGLGRPDPGRAADWEIEHYLAEQTDQLVAEGWQEADARREAERRFGDLARQRRRMVATDRRRRRMQRVGEWGETVRSGVLEAWRGIRGSPRLAVGVVLTLGLGIGVNAAMFGLVDRLLLRPPERVAHPEQLRRIYVEGQFFGRQMVTSFRSYPDLEDLRSVPQFASAGGYAGRQRYTLGTGAEARRVWAIQATPDFFTTLGVRPRLGRFFAKDEDALGATPTMVLSSEFWERSFGSDPSVLGRALELSGTRYTVIGVAPRGFTGVDLSPVDVWLPLVLSRYLANPREGFANFLRSREVYWLGTVVRMAEGASVEEGEARATALNVGSRADAVQRAEYDGHTRVIAAPLIAARGPAASDTSRVARWLAGVSLAVLLIACSNVANLLLAQGIRRKRGVALRLALGAPRSRVLVARAMESLLLAGLGGLVALVVAAWGGRLLWSLLVPNVLWSVSGQGLRVVVVTAGLAVAAGLLAGLGPAIRTTRTEPRRELLEGGRGSSLRRSRARRALAVTQVALSAVLLVGSGLFVRSLRQAYGVDLGLDTDHVVLATLEFRTRAVDAAERAERSRVYREATARLRGVPGVEALAVVDNPFGSIRAAGLTLPGVDSLPVPLGRGPFAYAVTAGYFETVGLRILQGRAIQETDDAEGAPRVAVVNETLARMLWPERSALGQCVHIRGQEECTTVVGVVEDASTGALDDDNDLACYLPLAQTDPFSLALYVRAAGDVRTVAGAVAPMLRSFSPDVRYAEVQTLDEVLAPQRRSWVLGASLFTAFGLLALLVAATGLYSLLAFDLAQRTREVGIRSALGASAGRLLWETLGQGAGLVVVGTVMGLAICLVVAPYVQPLLFHVPGRDPWVLATVGGVLLAVGALASLPTGLRATRVDPAEALRVE